MEDLNKNQIILLVLLVSFVTSIATGIMTTSLLQQAPVEVTRSINNVVEKTIQTVAPAVTTNNTVTQPKQTTTVVVTEEDQVISSINKNLGSIVRIKEKNPTTGESSLYGIGLIISKDETIAADRQDIIPGNIYTGILNDGSIVTLNPTAIDKNTNFILFKIPVSGTSAKVYSPAILSDSSPQLGQTLISLGGDVTNAVAVGRVVSLEMKDSGLGTSSPKVLGAIESDVSSKDLVDGSPIFNLSGEVLGIKLGNNSLKTFTPISVLKKEINTLTEP